jgi:pyruvate dehydrogenase E2 component (dihydrolipoamide acetyltransferase)
MAQFHLPDVGEGLTEAEIVSWKVRPGDIVAVNDVLVEIETAKSLVELPSPFAGTVESLLVDEGQTVTVGTAIISVETAGAEAAERVGEQPGEPVLVGYGPRPSRRRRRPPRPAVEGSAALHGAFSTGHEVGLPVAPPPLPHPVSPVGPLGESAAPALPAVGAFPDEDEPEPAPTPGHEPAGRPLAKPPVRRLARDLGVDLAQVVPSGPAGVITRGDVEAYARSAGVVGAEPQAASGWDGRPRTERVPVRSVRKATARAVLASAFTAPHVTQFLTVDVTASMQLLERLRSDTRFAGLRLSPLTVTARAVVRAAPRTPEINALWDGEAGEIVLRRYVDLGIATATPRGLLVPVVRDADRLDLRTLASGIADLTERARQGRTTPSETSGGTISITNIGVFGMDAGTPIMPPGHSAIVALGQVSRRPWVVERDGVEQVAARWVTTLSLSFDHRLLDGAQASAFLSDVADALRDPALAWATW